MADAVVRSNRLPPDKALSWWKNKAKELFFFLTVILHDSWKKAKFNDFGRLQKMLCDFMDPRNGRRRMFVSVFRGSFKTTILLGYCVYQFCWAVEEKRALSIVYNTATKENAQSFMEDFRQTISRNRMLHWIFPSLPKSNDEYRSWTNTRVETFGGVKFHVASLETQQVGRHYECILPGIFVHTSNGIEKIENVKEKDRVLCGDGTHTEVVATRKKHHKGKIVELKVLGQPETLKSTEEHLFLTWTWGSHRVAWKEAAKIEPGDYLCSPIPSGLTRAYSRTNKRLNKILETPEFWRFIGYWLAEGCASEGNRVRLTFGKAEMSYAEEVKKIIGRITGRPVNIHPTKSSTLMVDFADADVKEILNKFGTHSYNKHLPAFVLSSNQNRQRELILGYFRGDGHRVKYRWAATSVSRALLEGMRFLLARNGIESVIQAQKENPIISPVMGNYCKTRPSWTISSSSPLMNIIMGTPARINGKPSRPILLPGLILNRVKGKKIYHYEGPVYDLQVRKTESFSLIGGIAHNCIINDDWVNDTNAFSEIERERIKRKWQFQKAILTSYSKLGIGVEIDVGTLYWRGDLIDHIMRNSEGYEKFICPYEIRNSKGEKVLAFPEVYNRADFERKKADMGRTLFGTQYELRIIDENAAITTEKWILDWSALPDNYIRYLIIDASGSTEIGKRDPSGYLVADVDERARVFIRYIEEAWEETADAILHAQRLAKHFNVDETAYEKEKYSIAIAGVVERIAPGFRFALINHKNEPPEKRVFRLKQHFETGAILFGPNQERLKDQVLNYPAVEHDDLLMCLAHLVRFMTPPRRGMRREDAAEDIDFHEEMKRNRERMAAFERGQDMSYQF